MHIKDIDYMCIWCKEPLSIHREIYNDDGTLIGRVCNKEGSCQHIQHITLPMNVGG